jgi:hypothetical protein
MRLTSILIALGVVATAGVACKQRQPALSETKTVVSAFSGKITALQREGETIWVRRCTSVPTRVEDIAVECPQKKMIAPTRLRNQLVQTLTLPQPARTGPYRDHWCQGADIYCRESVQERELEAQNLLVERRRLVDLLAKFPATAAAQGAKEALAKLDSQLEYSEAEVMDLHKRIDQVIDEVMDDKKLTFVDGGDGKNELLASMLHALWTDQVEGAFAVPVAVEPVTRDEGRAVFGSLAGIGPGEFVVVTEMAPNDYRLHHVQFQEIAGHLQWPVRAPDKWKVLHKSAMPLTSLVRFASRESVLFIDQAAGESLHEIALKTGAVVKHPKVRELDLLAPFYFGQKGGGVLYYNRLTKTFVAHVATDAGFEPEPRLSFKLDGIDAYKDGSVCDINGVSPWTSPTPELHLGVLLALNCKEGPKKGQSRILSYDPATNAFTVARDWTPELVYGLNALHYGERVAFLRAVGPLASGGGQLLLRDNKANTEMVLSPLYSDGSAQSTEQWGGIRRLSFGEYTQLYAETIMTQDLTFFAELTLADKQKSGLWQLQFKGQQ